MNSDELTRAASEVTATRREGMVGRRWLLLAGLVLAARLVYALRLVDVTSSVPAGNLQVRGLYSIEDGDGSYATAKVLALEPAVVHLRVYKERFTIWVRDDTPASLILSSLRDSEGAEISHPLVAPSAFLATRPVFIRQTAVETDELQGERRVASGGVFGP
jgi:hypothetical protein